MKIALLGGSFDPIHEGHLQMAKEAYRQLQVDEVWFLVAKDTPLKTRKLTSFEHRCHMIEKVIRPYRHFKICTIENEWTTKSYTIHTVTALKKRYTHSFYFLMGEDQVAQLGQWKDILSLQEQVVLCAFSRNKKEIKTPYNVKVLAMKEVSISSTTIRNGFFQGMLPSVRIYAIQHGLYLDSIKEYMSTYRYEHSIRVAKLCKQIAKAHRLDENKAYLIGLLHDINKEWKWIGVEESEKLLAVINPQLLQYDKGIWHGYVGRFIVAHSYGIRDYDILQAIEHHVLGGSKNPYAQLVYLADKLDPGRDYDTSEMIEKCMQDMKNAYVQVKEQQEKYYMKEKQSGK